MSKHSVLKQYSEARTVVHHYDKRVEKLKNIRGRLLHIAQTVGSPLYVYDSEEAKNNLARFRNAFESHGLTVEPYFALKSNPYHGLLKTVVAEGGGLDVSSQLELSRALETNASSLVYTGPGKTIEDFQMILAASDREITVHLESITELSRLGSLVKETDRKITCGVRIVTSAQAKWNKFGIPLEELALFLEEAKKYPNISIKGLQFHISFILEGARYIQAFSEIGSYLSHLSDRSFLEFIDIGGGIYPEVFMGEYPWNPEGVVYLDDHDILDGIRKDTYRPRALPIEMDTIEEIVGELSTGFKKYIQTINPAVRLLAEPGRYICYSTMHTLLKVLDVKRPDAIIVDGGGNMVGWERYQYLHYVPLYNLTRFSETNEMPCIVYGPLCTPDDIWGYYLHGEAVQCDDIICMPFQGEYNYTLAQRFIREMPKVYDLWE